MRTTLQQCIDSWNKQADGFNQWPDLDADEKCEWCLQFARQQALDHEWRVITRMVYIENLAIMAVAEGWSVAQVQKAIAEYDKRGGEAKT